MDLNTTFRQDEDAGDFHGRTWRWQRVVRRQASRRRWALAGAVLLMVFALALVGPAYALQESAAYRQGRAAVATHPDIGAQYGAPLSFGMPGGGIQAAGPDGAAALHFDVRGPRGHGTVFVEARRRLGRWEIEHLVVENASGARVQIR